MNFRRTTIVLGLAVLHLFVARTAQATEETTDPYEGRLTGNWNGARTALADAGVDITVEYKADLMADASGGRKTGADYLDNLDLMMALDNEKLLGVHGNHALIYFINNDGGNPNNRHVGSLQDVDNIAVAMPAFKLAEAWDEQSFFDGKFSVLAGLRDVNAEFDVTDSTANFIKPIFQLGQEFAQSGRNGPSTFPNNGLALRLRASPTDETYLQSAAFDGVPGNPRDQYGTHISWRPSDGLLLVSEAGLLLKPEGPGDYMPNKFAVGAWTYTRRMNDLADTDADGNPLKSRQEGAYFISSQRLYQQDKESLVGFFHAGIADGATASVLWEYEAGAVAHGWIAARPDGEIGLGFSQSANSHAYIRAMREEGGDIAASEYGAELYYRDQLYRGIALQPDVQYVVHPSATPTSSNAFILGLRLDINL